MEETQVWRPEQSISANTAVLYTSLHSFRFTPPCASFGDDFETVYWKETAYIPNPVNLKANPLAKFLNLLACVHAMTVGHGTWQP